MHDVYAYGVIAPSTLVEIADPFPTEAGYAEVAGVHQSFGGEAAGGAYVLARLGLATKLAGSELSDDDTSRWVVEQLSSAGVDCSDVRMVDERGVTEFVVASGDQRTIFATYGQMLADQAWGAPQRGDILSSRLVCLDPFFGEASQQVARWCREGGIPYVTIDALPESDLIRHAEAAVISEEFAARTFGHHEAGELLRAYTDRCDGLVILTRGRSPLWYGRKGSAARRSSVFDVEVLDTTGAGDSFRAGVIFGLLRGMGDDDIVRTANAVAAMVCQSSPGVLHSPTESELADFLRTGTMLS